MENILENIEENYREFRDEIQVRFDKVDEHFDRIEERFDWMYGRVVSLIKWMVDTIALFGIIINILMAVFKFVGLLQAETE